MTRPVSPGKRSGLLITKPIRPGELKTSDLHDNLVKGTTLQLGLYALAMRELGAAEVSVSIISLAVKNVAPQLSDVDLASHTDVFADLAKCSAPGFSDER